MVGNFRCLQLDWDRAEITFDICGREPLNCYITRYARVVLSQRRWGGPLEKSFNLLVVDFASVVERANTTRDLALGYQQFIEKPGFAYFCVKSVSRHGAGSSELLTASPRSGWFGRWAATRYAKLAPLSSQHRQELRTTSWARFAEGRNAADREVLDEASQHGISEAWATGIELGRRQLEVLLLARAARNIRAEEEIALHFASALWGMKFVQFQHLKHASKESLSERERECLRWVAVGKTDWEMSKILGISEKTAQEHVGRAVTKLGAATRAHAVATALIGNLISL